eukprot:m.164302 g.164302  ORF g.164302 m.164302 type:complete len:398 (-) comp12403_c0_seq1:93-1286(-)
MDVLDRLRLSSRRVDIHIGPVAQNVDKSHPLAAGKAREAGQARRVYRVVFKSHGFGFLVVGSLALDRPVINSHFVRDRALHDNVLGARRCLLAVLGELAVEIGDILLGPPANLVVEGCNEKRHAGCNDKRHPCGCLVPDLAVEAHNRLVGLVGANLLANTLGEHKERVDGHSEEDEHRVERNGAVERVLVTHNAIPHGRVQGHGEEHGQKRRKNPRGDNARHALGNVQPVNARLLVPHDARGALDGNRHANHATHGGVGRRHRHLVHGGDKQPKANRNNDRQVAVNQQSGVISIVVKTLGISNALSERLCHSTSCCYGTGGFGNESGKACLTDRQASGSHTRGPCISDIVGTDTKGGKEGSDCAENKNPFILFEGSHCVWFVPCGSDSNNDQEIGAV